MNRPGPANRRRSNSLQSANLTRKHPTIKALRSYAKQGRLKRSHGDTEASCG
ncbi:MAG: hypothetical protein AVDCRST_MAG68-4185 [uncultured Gemmatimonadetes bacterium]|uniref:Uncharacterized protein n=1 Tax=uncultured Gemmatimonadota bacterium TaxID=203437 RepID=A0A6J4MHI2_9BACT|nr:MAG: hypothetical protein AVDCRST_MAG68-4185 [uncultured Gemmatimonadota bacterium]